MFSMMLKSGDCAVLRILISVHKTVKQKAEKTNDNAKVTP